MAKMARRKSHKFIRNTRRRSMIARKIIQEKIKSKKWAKENSPLLALPVKTSQNRFEEMY